MNSSSTTAVIVAMLSVAAASHGADVNTESAAIMNLQPYTDPTGAIATFNANGPIDTRGAFFQSLGTNGRSCSTCHVADQAMSISAADVRARFQQTRGRDPLFASVDGANCPNAR